MNPILKIKFLIVVVFVISITNNQAQSTSQITPLEVGLIVNTTSFRPNDTYNVSLENQWHPQLLNGILFRGKRNKSIFRTYLSRISVKDGENPIRQIYEGTSNYERWNFAIGFEKYLSKKKLKSYFIYDFLLIKSKSTGTFSGEGAYMGRFVGVYGIFSAHSIGVAVAPAFGLRLDFSKRWSLNAEATLELTYLRRRVYREDWVLGSKISESRESTLQLQFSLDQAVKFGVNYKL